MQTYPAMPASGPQTGFTLIEILMVVMLVSILTAFTLPQFIDFRGDAADSAVHSALGAMRSAINIQTLQMRVHCNAPPGTYPTAAQLNANDVTAGAIPCTTAQVPAISRPFMATGAIPDNIWGGATPKNNVIPCVGANTGCNQKDDTDCSGGPYKAASTGCATDALAGVSTGWCYNPATGEIWANSANSRGPVKEYLF